MKRAEFPMIPVSGQQVFFVREEEPNKLCLFGTISHRDHDRRKAIIHNSTSNIKFDPLTGKANRFYTPHQLVLVFSKGYFESIDYEGSFVKAQIIWNNILKREKQDATRPQPKRLGTSEPTTQTFTQESSEEHRVRMYSLRQDS